MTSTPPAWKWRDECDVPVTNYTLADLLSIHSRKPPESDALRERNGSGTEPEESCFTTRKLDTFPTGEDVWPLERECDCTAQNYNEHINAVPEHVEKCPACLHELENDEGILCDHCGEPTGPGSFAVVNGPGGVFVYHLHCYDEVYHPDDGQESEEPSDEARECEARCQANLAALMAEGYRDVEETDTFSVPFQAQEWFFEALIETEINHLHEIIDDHHDEILEMARKRHREGFVAYGSKGYSWDPKTRLRNVLEELSDGGTYLTMGPIE